MISLFAISFGAIVGSFLNVVIYRLPLGKSVVTPRSTCGKCQKIIPWYYNIPILSFLFLRAKCGLCGAPISFRYPLVELLVALLSFKIFSLDLMLGLDGILYFAIGCIFICHFFIDFDHQILPDSLNIALAIIFFYLGVKTQGLLLTILGGAIGLGFPLMITYLFYKIRGVIGLGGGDIKLFGALGLFLGIKGVLYCLILSCWVGSIIGLILILTKKLNKDHPFAFGPAILIAAGFQIFFPGKYLQFWSLIGIQV